MDEIAPNLSTKLANGGGELAQILAQPTNPKVCNWGKSRQTRQTYTRPLMRGKSKSVDAGDCLLFGARRDSVGRGPRAELCHAVSLARNKMPDSRRSRNGGCASSQPCIYEKLGRET
jgi:hypothetical protein